MEGTRKRALELGGVHAINKPVGMTPLECLERFRVLRGVSAEERMSYAGRLDPMACGVLLLLEGERFGMGGGGKESKEGTDWGCAKGAIDCLLFGGNANGMVGGGGGI